MTQRRFVLLYALSIAAAGLAFVTHLALRFQNIAIGYAIQSARDEAGHMRQRLAELRLERGARRAPQAMAELGRSELGMVEPDRVLTMVAGGSAGPTRLAGRPR